MWDSKKAVQLKRALLKGDKVMCDGDMNYNIRGQGEKYWSLSVRTVYCDLIAREKLNEKKMEREEKPVREETIIF